MQHWLETILPIALHDDRGACVEINIQVFSLACSDGELSAGNLSGWDFDTRLRFARELKSMYAAVGAEHRTVRSISALVIRNLRCTVIVQQDDSNLLIISRLQLHFGSERREKTLIGG